MFGKDVLPWEVIVMERPLGSLAMDNDQSTNNLKGEVHNAPDQSQLEHEQLNDRY